MIVKPPFCVVQKQEWQDRLCGQQILKRNGELNREREERIEQVPQTDRFSDGPGHRQYRLLCNDFLGSDQKWHRMAADSFLDAKLRIDDPVPVRFSVGIQVL